MTTPGRRARRKMDPTVIERFDDWRKAKEDRIATLEAALVKLIDAIDAKDAKAIEDALFVGRGLTF